tara:strand:+ start:583 stop:3300 length:2718 start_codon:yes stop_codon:yes gene_type:complete
MNKIIYHIILCCSFLIAHGDSDENHSHGHGKGHHHQGSFQMGSVNGLVIDADSKKVISYAAISLYRSDTKKLVQGVISDEDGYFSIEKIRPGNFFLAIEFIGYKLFTIEDIQINKDNGLKVDLGTISLTQQAIEAEQINVIDDTPIIEFETDKIVYVPSEDVLATGGSAEDVLNNVPMVLVDQDGAVSLKGSSNVKIMVNGRENRIGEGGNDVDDIPADQIEKVEVITSPSAKYDPEGMAGIINIILKKNSDIGFNAEVKIFSENNKNHNFNEMGGISLSGNYKKKKYNLYGLYSGKIKYRDREGYRKSTTIYTDSAANNEDQIYETHFSWVSQKKKNNQVLRLGTDYYLDEQTTLNIETRYNAYYSSEESIDTTFLPIDNAGIKTHSEIEPEGNYELGLSFGLDKTFENPEQSLSVFYSFDKHPVDEEYDISLRDNLEDRSDISSTLQSQEFKISYIHPISQKSKIDLGAEFDQTDNNEEMNYYLHTSNSQNRDETGPHISGINTYGYKRNIFGSFLEYSAELNDKWSIKPGIRFEYVDKNIQFSGNPNNVYCNSVSYDSFDECIESCNTICQLTASPTDELGAYAQILEENNNTNIDKDYTSVYPSFHITYNIDMKKSVQFAISSRVERPGGGHHGGSRQIRPFPRDIHSNNFIFLGNPSLEPEYSTNYEISYKSTIMTKSNQWMGIFSTNIHYEHVRDKIEWYSSNEYEFDVLTFRNADEGKGYGLELFLMLFGQTIGGGFWYNEIQDGSDDAELNGFNKGFNSYGKINLPEKYIKYFGFQFGYYYMKMSDSYGTMLGDKGSVWANLGLSKSLLQKKAKLSFKIDNIFDSGGFSMKRTKPLVYNKDYIPNGYDGGSEYTDMLSSRNGRTYSITFQYNFGNMERDKRLRDNQRRGGGGMDMGM